MNAAHSPEREILNHPRAIGVYGSYAPEYRAAGLRPFPVRTRDKKPAVKDWQRPSNRSLSAWTAKFSDADGLGINMGAQSGLSEVDVDAVGPAHIAAAIERFGETPIIIQTASGKAKLYYRHNGERRMIRPISGMPIDVLGAGFSIAPPSRRDDLGASYRFVSGGLDDLANLPTIRASALGTDTSRAVQAGTRNNTLFLWCMSESRQCDDVEGLIDAAETWALAMPDPLPLAEIRKTAKSAWSYEEKGKNFVGLKRPQLNENDKMMDMLNDKPDAFFLLSLLQRYHSEKPNFVIAPRAMAKAGNPAWGHPKIENARDILLERGLIVQISAPRQGGRPGRYRLSLGAKDGGKGV